MKLDDELPAYLARRVEHVHVSGDLADVEVRSGRRRARRRAASRVAAAALVAMAGGVGFGLGRQVDGDASVAAGPADADATAADERASADSTVVAPEPAISAPTPAATAPSPKLESGADATTAYRGGDVNGGMVTTGWGPLQGQPAELLYARVTPTGYTLRVHRGPSWDTGDMGYGDGEWQPAPWCFTSAEMRLAVASDTVIDVGSAGWWTEPFQGLAATSFALGGPDGAPLRALVVQVGADVTSVAVTFSDGASDEAAPANGVVALAVPGQGDGDPAAGLPGSFELVIDRGDGTESVVDDTALAASYSSDEWYEGCSPPPPALPEPGVGPADPAAAEADIAARFTLLYDGSVAAEDKPADLLDDDAGVAEARQAVLDGGFAESARTARVEIDELVFTAPDEAWFRYTIRSDSGDFRDRFGVVHLVAGSWRFARAVLCQDLALAGGTCEPYVDPVLPPGADVTQGDVLMPGEAVGD
jgi:hypothetical protein